MTPRAKESVEWFRRPLHEIEDMPIQSQEHGKRLGNRLEASEQLIKECLWIFTNMPGSVEVAKDMAKELKEALK